jgi:diacylglycerol O-acyltransferase
MARYAYDRLTGASADFLAAETSRSHAHSATTLVFERGPLGRDDGGVDFAAIRSGIEARLHLAPRLRQRIKRIPFENHPVWVDDPHFNLEYHLRHTSLPRPGGMDQLDRMSARIKSQRLDRGRPLWECWVLEGLEGDRFALLLKTHHCMIDPLSQEGDLFQALLSPDPRAATPDAPIYRPRPMPSAFELVVDEVVRGLRLPRKVFERAQQLSSRRDLRHELESRARTVARLLGYTIRGPHETPLNGATGPQRRFDHLTHALDDARAVREALGGSLNDVILAAVAGAVRAFLEERLVNPATLDFRISNPVSLARDEEERDEVGEWIIELPVWEAQPEARLENIREQTRRLGRELPARSARELADPARWTGSRMLALGARAASGRIPVNLAVVNVPGPQQPLYFLGARLLEGYGQAPLREHNALGIVVFSYDGRLCWGLNADFDLLPDLDRFRGALDRAFRELVRAARGRETRLEVVRE